MENTNEMQVIFDGRSSNESFARVTVASFMTALNPTVEEVSDVKTAVSEAVTNAIIHGYESEIHNISIHCRTEGQTLYLEVRDEGKGIEDIKQAMELEPGNMQYQQFYHHKNIARLPHIWKEDFVVFPQCQWPFHPY